MGSDHTMDTAQQPPAESNLAVKRRNIEAIYPLRPIQKALMLYADTGTGAGEVADPGFLQVRFSLCGPLDVAALRAAWERVIQRHAGLRMSVQSTPGQEAMMVVWRRLDAPWRYLDRSGVPAAQRNAELSAWLAADRARGLDLARPPVMRMHVVRTAARQHEVVWSCHHLLLDGWSAVVVVNDLLAAYRAIRSNQPDTLGPVTSTYRDYLAWLKRRDGSATEAFWRRTLRGMTDVSPLRLELRDRAAGDGASGYAAVSTELDTATSRTLRAACASMRVTPGVLIQGAWALLLSALQQRDDVLFGATVAGRPADLAGIETLVGFFSNTIPVRVRLAADRSAAAWLQQLRDDQAQAQLFAHADPTDLQAWSGAPGNRPLYESLVVVENFPWQAPASADELQLVGFRSGITTTYPLTLSAIPSGAWSFTVNHERSRFSTAAIEALMAQLTALMNQLAANPDTPVTHVLDGLRAATAQEFTLAGPDRIEPDDDAARRAADDVFAAPRNATELQLALIWEETLGVSPIGVDDDFFALGGTSIAAVRLFAAIEARLGRKLAVATLLEKPTIARLAADIASHTASPWKSLVPIQAGGTRPPLFCVHAGGGHVLFYRHLAKRLGPEQPVFGLQPLGLDGDHAPLPTIEQMAALYADELCSVQPDGPYHLVGYCIGGTVGLEIARELERRGQRVARLVVLDSGFFFGPRPRKTTAGKFRTTADQIVAVARTDGVAHVPRAVAREMRQLALKLLRKLNRRWRLKHAAPADQRQVWLELVEEACNMAWRTYSPHPCQAPVTLIRTAEYASMKEKDTHLTWGELTPRLDVHVIAAGHETLLLEPEVEHVARILAGCLEPIHDEGSTGAALNAPV